MNSQQQARSTKKEGAERQGRATAAVRDARERLLAWMPVTERRLELAGVSTAFLEGGSGPPLILLHGPFAYAGHWLRVVAGLATTRRVIAPDLPGHGASHATEGALSVEGMVTWLAELIERTCASPPVVIAQLLGGALAARFASRHSARLSHLVLVDSFGLAPLQLPREFALALNQYCSQPTQVTHDALWRHCAFDLESLRQRMGQRWESFAAYNLQLAQTPSVLAAVSVLMEQFASAIPDEELRRIAVPTTLVWGRHDRGIPLAIAEAASGRFGWPLHVIEDSADDPPVEQPEALLRVLRAALDPSKRMGEEGTRHA